MKKSVILILTAALAANSLSAISVSADAQDDSAPAYTITEAQYAAWAEYGISAEELDELIRSSTPTGIKDFIYHVKATGNVTGATCTLTNVVTPANLTYFSVSNTNNITNVSTNTSYDFLAGTYTRTDSGTIASAGRLFIVYFTRLNTSTSISSCFNSIGVSISNAPGSYSVEYPVVTDDEDFIWLGDANHDGYVDVSDVMTITDFVAEVPCYFPDAGKAAADVNQDYHIDMDDAWLIQQYIAHINTHVWG